MRLRLQIHRVDGEGIVLLTDSVVWCDYLVLKYDIFCCSTALNVPVLNSQIRLIGMGRFHICVSIEKI